LKEAFDKNKSLRNYSQKSIPQACIPEKWKKYLYETKTIPCHGKTKKCKMLNIDKYEFLVYKLLKVGLDAGDIFIKDSRNFKSFEEDLISEKQWQQKDTLIKSLNLPYLHEPIETILERKETELEATIKRVNDSIRQGKNPDIKITGTGENIHWHLPYSNDEEPIDHSLYAQLPQMSIIDILTSLRLFISKQTAFLLLPICLVAMGSKNLIYRILLHVWLLLVKTLDFIKWQQFLMFPCRI